LFKLLLAAVLIISGSLLLILAARSFKSIKANLALVLTAFLFLGQATVLLNQVRVTVPAGAPAVDSQASASSELPGQIAWDQGGTLTQAKLGKWRLGDYSDRLASAAALLKTLRQQRQFVASIRSEQDYRPWAAALVACLEASQAGDEAEVPGLARQCTQEHGLQKYL
jgi:hypothetical protein